MILLQLVDTSSGCFSAHLWISNLSVLMDQQPLCSVESFHLIDLYPPRVELTRINRNFPTATLTRYFKVQGLEFRAEI